MHLGSCTILPIILTFNKHNSCVTEQHGLRLEGILALKMCDNVIDALNLQLEGIPCATSNPNKEDETLMTDKMLTDSTDRMNQDLSIPIKNVTTSKQLADILTKRFFQS